MKIGEKKNYGIFRNGNYVSPMRAECIQNGGFQYGNSTLTVITYWNKNDETTREAYDTRYFVGELEDFVRWWVEDTFGKHYEAREEI